MSEAQSDVKSIDDAALAAAAKNAHARGASEPEILKAVRQFVPVGKVYGCAPEQRPALIEALAHLGCPAPAFEIVRRLVDRAKGYGGNFTLCGLAEGGAPIIHRIKNEGEPRFIYRQFGRSFRETEFDHKIGVNIHLEASLKRDGIADGQRGLESDVIGVLAVVADFDAKHNPETRHDRLPIFPHGEIETSPGNFQSWFFLDRPYPVAEIKPTLTALAETSGADDCKSAEHLWRLPGTLHYPTAKKIAAGRSPVPFLARWAQMPDDWHDTVSLAAFRSAIEQKYPRAYEAQEAEKITASEFDWDQRYRPQHTPINEAEITAILDNPKYEGDRSGGCWAFINQGFARGMTPAEIRGAMLDHSDASAMRHYRRDRLEEDVEADIKRAVEKMPAVPNTMQPMPQPRTKLAIVLPAPTELRVEFPDLNQRGYPRATTANARVALKAVGFQGGYDAFGGYLTVGGKVLNEWEGEISDEIVVRLCHACKQVFDFEPAPTSMRTAIEQLCYENRFNSVVDYLAGLKWDGTKHIDDWLIRHGGAPDTPFVRAVCRLMLVAAVRRAREPGCKFDEVIVLESPEGFNKSSALALMAGAEHFSDQSLLKEDERRQQEHLRGKWLYEIADLTGIGRADRDAIKAMASRAEDRARPAYGHFEIKQPRMCILCATTNDTDYLEGDTGHRRWWPVPIAKTIDLAALAAERDQLWAEAAQAEADGESIRLAAELWKAAAAEQEGRRLHDPWEAELAQIRGWAFPDAAGRPDWHEQRLSSADVLTCYLRIEPGRQTGAHGKRAKRILQRLGWEHRRTLRFGDHVLKGYSRLVNRPLPAEPQHDPQVPWHYGRLPAGVGRTEAS